MLFVHSEFRVNFYKLSVFFSALFDMDKAIRNWESLNPKGISFFSPGNTLDRKVQ